MILCIRVCTLRGWTDSNVSSGPSGGRGEEKSHYADEIPKTRASILPKNPQPLLGIPTYIYTCILLLRTRVQPAIRLSTIRYIYIYIYMYTRACYVRRYTSQTRLPHYNRDRNDVFPPRVRPDDFASLPGYVRWCRRRSRARERRRV